jgi:hypothetical protein
MEGVRNFADSSHGYFQIEDDTGFEKVKLGPKDRVSFQLPHGSIIVTRQYE